MMDEASCPTRDARTTAVAVIPPRVSAVVHTVAVAAGFARENGGSTLGNRERRSCADSGYPSKMIILQLFISITRFTCIIQILIN